MVGFRDIVLITAQLREVCASSVYLYIFMNPLEHTQRSFIPPHLNYMHTGLKTFK